MAVCLLQDQVAPGHSSRHDAIVESDPLVIARGQLIRRILVCLGVPDMPLRYGVIEQNQVAIFGYWLIDQDVRVKFYEPVQPRGIVLRHIHAAMRSMYRVLCAALVEVGKIRAGAVLTAPPTVVQEVPVAMELHGVVNRRRRIPVR